MTSTSTSATKDKGEKGREELVGSSSTPLRVQEVVNDEKRSEVEREQKEASLETLTNGPESHLTSTPPEAVQPLFTREQIHGLHEMYSQSPFLYPQFQTPQAAPYRPGFLVEEEEKKEAERKGRVVRRLEEVEKEEREVERYEKEELNRRLHLLAQENQRLRDQTTSVYPLLKTKDEVEDSSRRLVFRLIEENRMLKVHLQRLLAAQQKVKESCFCHAQWQC